MTDGDYGRSRSDPAPFDQGWFDLLEEGVVQVRGGLVVRLNAAAARLGVPFVIVK